MTLLQLQENNYDFFPLNQALSLQNEEDSQEVKLQMLVKNVDYMVNKMKEEVQYFYVSDAAIFKLLCFNTPKWQAT